MQTAKLDTNAASAPIRGRATAQACAELRTSMERRGVSLASMDLLIAATRWPKTARWSPATAPSPG